MGGSKSTVLAVIAIIISVSSLLYSFARLPQAVVVTVTETYPIIYTVSSVATITKNITSTYTLPMIYTVTSVATRTLTVATTVTEVYTTTSTVAFTKVNTLTVEKTLTVSIPLTQRCVEWPGEGSWAFYRVEGLGLALFVSVPLNGWIKLYSNGTHIFVVSNFNGVLNTSIARVDDAFTSFAKQICTQYNMSSLCMLKYSGRETVLVLKPIAADIYTTPDGLAKFYVDPKTMLPLLFTMSVRNQSMMFSASITLWDTNICGLSS